jgi:plasmid maintenance system killer protein
MNVAYTTSTARTVAGLTGAIRKALYKQVHFLLADLRHPSLHAKKYDEAGDLWQARVNRDWRFYFRIEGDTYVITDVIPHPK